MKKVINIVFSVLICISVIAQNNDLRAQFSEELYLNKSQNITAWILTGAGAAMAITGLVFISSDWNYFNSDGVGAGLLIAGGAAVVGGVVLFNASKRSTHISSGSSVSLNLQMEQATLLRGTVMRKNTFPALSVRLGYK